MKSGERQTETHGAGLLKFAQSIKPEALEILRSLVERESPSNNRDAVNAIAEYTAGLFEQVGGRSRLHKQREYGHVLQVDFSGPKKPGVLLLGHLDTVWEIGTLARMPWKVSAGKIHGPGIFDMKFGVVQMLYAIKALQQIRGGLPRPVTVLLNPDEEVGSRASRPFTEKLAKKCGSVLVFEPSAGVRGACKTSRKGVGDYRVRVHGRPSHAGLDFETGASAILELARQIEKISQFTDLKHGITVNPGVISGGTRTNVVAEFAEALIDVRVTKTSQAPALDRKFHSLKPVDRRCSIEVSGGVNRGPLERNQQTLALYRKAKDIASDLGFELPEISVGGGSDGNFTAAIGIPTLDGLGAVGDGAHAVHEHIVEAEIPRRIALAARLIEEL